MKKKFFGKAFSLIELSIVVLIVGLLVSGIMSGNKLISLSNISKARTLTNSSPVNTIDGLILWLETTSNNSFIGKPTNGTAIDTWRNINSQLNIKNDAVQSVSANQPIYIDKAVNGLPAIQFNGNTVQQYLLVTNSAGDTNLIAPQTIFIVFQQLANSRAIISKAAISRGSNSNRDWEVIGTGTNLSYVIIYNAGTSNSQVASPFTLMGTNQIVTCRWDGTANTNAASVNLNGALFAQTTPGGSDANNNYSLYIGGIVGFSFHGYIGEVIIYNRVLNDFEVSEIEKYLSKKWAIKLT